MANNDRIGHVRLTGTMPLIDDIALPRARAGSAGGIASARNRAVQRGMGDAHPLLRHASPKVLPIGLVVPVLGRAGGALWPDLRFCHWNV